MEGGFGGGGGAEGVDVPVEGVDADDELGVVEDSDMLLICDICQVDGIVFFLIFLYNF